MATTFVGTWFASGVLEQDGEGRRFAPRRSVPNHPQPVGGAVPNSFAGLASKALSQTPLGT